MALAPLGADQSDQLQQRFFPHRAKWHACAERRKCRLNSGSAVKISPAGTLVLDNREGARDFRLGQRGIHFGGNLTIIGAENALTTEGVSNSNLLSGLTHSVLTLDATGTGQVLFRITGATGATFSRNSRGTSLYRGDLLGTGDAPGSTKMTAQLAPTFIGESGGSGNSNMGILPWAVVDTTVTEVR